MSTTLSGSLIVRLETTADPNIASVTVITSGYQGTSLVVNGTDFGILNIAPDLNNPLTGTFDFRTGKIDIIENVLVRSSYLELLGLSPVAVAIPQTGTFYPMSLLDGVAYLIGQGTLPYRVPLVDGATFFVTCLTRPDLSPPEVISEEIQPGKKINNVYTISQTTITITKTISDTGSGVDRVIITIKDKNGKVVAEGELSLTAGDVFSGTWTGTIKLPPDLADGKYTVNQINIDRAGRISTLSTVLQVDRTPPSATDEKIEPSVDVKGVITISATDITIIKTLTDKGSGADNIKVEVSEADGNIISRGELSLSSGDVFSGIWSGAIHLPDTIICGDITIVQIMTDRIGNVATKSFPTLIKVDRSGPTITYVLNPVPNRNNWNNRRVTVSFTATDVCSGVAAVNPSHKTFSEEGEGQTVTCVATDLVGNQSEITVTVNIDWTPPAVTHTIIPQAPNEKGWYNKPVKVTFEATDNLSGIDRYEPDKTHTFEEGKNQQFTCTVYDKADNVASDTVKDINVDLTPPEFTKMPEHMVVEQNCYEGVGVSEPFIQKFLKEAAAKDTLSGPAKIVPTNDAPKDYFPLGLTIVTFTAKDNADNSTKIERGVLIMDKTPPVITVPKEELIVVVTELTGVPKSNPQIQAFLNEAKATDLCDREPTLTNNAPDFFPLGKTIVTFTARDRSGNVSHKNVIVMVVSIDLIARGHDFNNPKTGSIVVPQDKETSPGAYVHYNIDNDNGNIKRGEPVADKDEIARVSGENDLMFVLLHLEPVPEKGIVTLRRTSSGIRVWRRDEKGGGAKVLVDNDKIIWDLSKSGQRDDFLSKRYLWVEGYEKGSAFLYLDYAYEGILGTDDVRYIFIAATCGRQPKPPERTDAQNTWENLVNCEWSITAEQTPIYNCIAWSVGETSVWYNKLDSEIINVGGILVTVIGIDEVYGDNDNIFEISDMDAFYDAKGYTPTATGPTDADIMYYSGYHGAKKMIGCTDGAGKWIMFESKTGGWIRMEHVWNQLNSSIPDSYGTPVRYYKRK